MGIRLMPIANEVLAACPEYKYATKGYMSKDSTTSTVKFGTP